MLAWLPAAAPALGAALAAFFPVFVGFWAGCEGPVTSSCCVVAGTAGASELGLEEMVITRFPGDGLKELNF